MGISSKESKLIKFRSCSDNDRERARENLDVEVPRIAFRDFFKHRAALSHEPSEYVQAACGALGVSFGAHIRREGQTFNQPNDEHVPRAQHGGLAQVDFAKKQFSNLWSDQRLSTWKEAGANPVCYVSKAQVNACRLKLLIRNFHPGTNLPVPNQLSDIL